jgi:hypothetical protein
MKRAIRQRTLRNGSLEERALRDLIERHGDKLALADLPWLGGLLGKLRQGYPLTAEQVGRVSAIRGERARAQHGR